MPISESVLASFINHNFVETGTYRGGGIAAAKKAGFKHIYSTDIDKNRVEAVKRNYTDDDMVSIYALASPDFLRKVIPGLTAPTTFWLDAHPPGYNLNRTNCPVWDELAVISECKVPYIILIDDVVCFKPKALSDLLTTIYRLNPGMNVRRVKGHATRHADVIVIYPAEMTLTAESYTITGEPLVIEDPPL